jgi:hypothetical protein
VLLALFADHPHSGSLQELHFTANVLSRLKNTCMNMPAKKSVNFEKALAELEKLVEEMEQGNLSLEESLKRFEKGISLRLSGSTAKGRAQGAGADREEWQAGGKRLRS